MNLTFNQVGNVYVAEFEVTSDFSIHIEKPEGSIAMGQSSVAGGQYDNVRSFSYDAKDRVIDTTVIGAIYPKQMKITCSVMPTMAVLSSEGDVVDITKVLTTPV